MSIKTLMPIEAGKFLLRLKFHILIGVIIGSLIAFIYLNNTVHKYSVTSSIDIPNFSSFNITNQTAKNYVTNRLSIEVYKINNKYNLNLDIKDNKAIIRYSTPDKQKIFIKEISEEFELTVIEILKNTINLLQIKHKASSDILSIVMKRMNSFFTMLSKIIDI